MRHLLSVSSIEWKDDNHDSSMSAPSYRNTGSSFSGEGKSWFCVVLNVIGLADDELL